MARSVSEIEQHINDVKATKPELDTLNSTSATSVWGGIRFVVATAIWLHEKLFDLFKEEVDAKVSQRNYGTAPWWAAQMREFRYGQTPVIIDHKITYLDLTQEPTVTRCAAINRDDASGARVELKLAKGQGGALEPLLPAEFEAAVHYRNIVQPAGVRVVMTSIAADKLKAEGIIYFNPQLGLIPSQQAVSDAMKAYLTSLATDSNFNGRFHRSALHDAVQRVAGVGPDSHFTNLTATAVSEPDPISIFQSYETRAGYIVEDPANTFINTLTWIADE